MMFFLGIGRIGRIGWAYISGITAGIGGGRFDADGTITRAQIVTFLYRTVNLLQQTAGTQTPTPASSPATVRMGVNACCADFALWQIPIQKGWFNEVGITIEPSGGQLLRTGVEAISTLRDRDLDVAPAWVPGLFGALETFGQSIPPVFFTDVYIGYMILVPPDSDAKTVLEFMNEGMSFPDAAEAAMAQLVGKDIHIPPHSTLHRQYPNAFLPT